MVDREIRYCKKHGYTNFFFTANQWNGFWRCVECSREYEADYYYKNVDKCRTTARKNALRLRRSRGILP